MFHGGRFWYESRRLARMRRARFLTWDPQNFPKECLRKLGNIVWLQSDTLSLKFFPADELK